MRKRVLITISEWEIADFQIALGFQFYDFRVLGACSVQVNQKSKDEI